MQAATTTKMSSEEKADGDPAPLLKTDSRKRMDGGDEKRRNRFKERSKNLQRGVSAPSFNQGLLSEGGTSKGPLAPMPLTKNEAVTVGQSLGHEFNKKTFHKPTYCHHCTELLWGFTGQGLQCTGELLQTVHVETPYNNLASSY